MRVSEYSPEVRVGDDPALWSSVHGRGVAETCAEGVADTFPRAPSVELVS
jgi:hypothetical protein